MPQLSSSLGTFKIYNMSRSLCIRLATCENAPPALSVIFLASILYHIFEPICRDNKVLEQEQAFVVNGVTCTWLSNGPRPMGTTGVVVSTSSHSTYATVERTYRGSCHRIYCRNFLENRHPSHWHYSTFVSINHELAAFLFNVLIIVLINLL